MPALKTGPSLVSSKCYGVRVSAKSVATWIDKARLAADQCLFPSRFAKSPHLSTRQYACIAASWARSIGLDTAAYSTHTMRRTKATLICRHTKKLRAVQLLLGHAKLESTVRYLEIEVDDALKIAEQSVAQIGRMSAISPIAEDWMDPWIARACYEPQAEV